MFDETDYLADSQHTDGFSSSLIPLEAIAHLNSNELRSVCVCEELELSKVQIGGNHFTLSAVFHNHV